MLRKGAHIIKIVAQRVREPATTDSLGVIRRHVRQLLVSWLLDGYQ